MILRFYEFEFGPIKSILNLKHHWSDEYFERSVKYVNMTAQFCGQSKLTNPNQKIKVNPTNHSVPKIPYSDFIPKKSEKFEFQKNFEI